MKIIAHLDLDAFFAAVEERENPQFAGRPIVVGADPKGGKGRGVVATANYQAREYGISSGMPISLAWRLAQVAVKKGKPPVIFLPPNHSYYLQVSEKIMKILQSYSSLVEQTSIDEAYLDFSFSALKKEESSQESFFRAKRLVEKIKKEIREKEKLTASVGLAPNKLLAKIASKKAKPNGLTVVLPQEIQAFLDPLPVEEIPGIGPKTREFLHQRKIFRVKDLRKVKKETLISWLGKWGESLYEKARGIDDSPLEVVRKIKSISEQETFPKDTLSSSFLLSALEKLARELIERMRKEGFLAFKTLKIMVRFSDFATTTRSHTLEKYTDDFSVLKKEAWKLFLPFLDRRENPQKKLIRLLGLGIENFLPLGEKKPSEKEKKITPLFFPWFRDYFPQKRKF